jgi:hypothetical protein
MSVSEPSQNFSENKLLAALPQQVYESLLPHLSPVQLVTGQVVYEPFSPISYGYFLNNSLISCMSVTEQGASVAVGFVGKEGMLGAASLIDASLLPYRIIGARSQGSNPWPTQVMALGGSRSFRIFLWT